MSVNYIALWSLIGCIMSINLNAQSLESMVGNQGIFLDIQWLKPIDGSQNWSIFSRTRATISYSNDTDVFTGAYINWTSKHAVGTSLVGRVGSNGAGADIGIHLFKRTNKWMIFALTSVALNKVFEYSWFSIIRYTPPINDSKKLYCSLEWYSLFRAHRHLVGVQRLRIGIDHGTWQYGIANNLTELGTEWKLKNNLGVFFRKNF